MTEKSINEVISDLVTPGEVDRFSNPNEARKKAMDLLARREHTRDELCRKLEKAGFDSEVAFDAIGALSDEGLQSDERFVESFVQSRIKQGKGPARIRADLGHKGVRAAMIDAAIEEAGADWCALARETRARKFGPDLPDDFKEKARQMRFLQYRGFESDHIQSAF
ncbi:MAG: regulatory protein RecX [Woeseiaceae bacterium]|nr:regulatory protein RecX [Woeseiaceae bacterium]